MVINQGFGEIVEREIFDFDFMLGKMFLKSKVDKVEEKLEGWSFKIFFGGKK